MQYGDSVGSGNYTSFSSSAATAAGLGGVRERTLPELAAPRIGLPDLRPWVVRIRQTLSKYAVLAAIIVAAAALAAMAVPAWAALQSETSTSRLGTVNSSAAITGTADTRVADLSATTFIGGIPYLQQSRALDASVGAVSAPARFVAGAREASVGSYVETVGQQMVLPYINDAATTKEGVETWQAAIEEQERAAQVAAPVTVSAPYTVAFEPSGIAPGTVLHASTTFYACVGNGFCGNMASGAPVYAGAAACSYDLPFGTKFFVNSDPSRRVFTCMDRGALSATWVDVWFYDASEGWSWQRATGTSGAITIVE